MKDRIVQLANEALTRELGVGDVEQWGIGPGKELSAEQLLDAIDLGNYGGGRTGRMFSVCLRNFVLNVVQACGQSIPSTARKVSFAESSTLYVSLSLSTPKYKSVSLGVPTFPTTCPSQTALKDASSLLSVAKASSR